MLVYLTWRPYAIRKRFMKQGIGGPNGKFWSRSLEEIWSVKKAGSKLILDINNHDITLRVLPHYLKWISWYGLFKLSPLSSYSRGTWCFDKWLLFFSLLKACECCQRSLSLYIYIQRLLIFFVFWNTVTRLAHGN